MKKKNERLLPTASRPLLFAHRGCSRQAPENSLSAFRKVLEFNIPGVELDIHRCKSGELVVIHDFNLQRLTGKDAEVEDMELDLLRDLDCGSWFSREFIGERIPLLDEVFDLLGDRVYYDIEIKQRGKATGPLERSLLSKLEERSLKDRTVVSSFNPYPLRELRRLDTHLQTALIYTNRPEFPLLLRTGGGRFICRPTALKPEGKDISRLSLFLKKKLGGYPLLPWTIDEQGEAERLLNLGVDGIISNVPEQLVETIESYKR